MKVEHHLVRSTWPLGEVHVALRFSNAPVITLLVVAWAQDGSGGRSVRAFHRIDID